LIVPEELRACPPISVVPIEYGGEASVATTKSRMVATFSLTLIPPSIEMNRNHVARI
jgi:hypothetical protein